MLAVFAHPDDESFGPGGTLARYSREGIWIGLVCATRGEAGKTGDPPACAPEELGPTRERELRAACKVLGISDLVVLGYPDGGLDRVDPGEATGRIAREIRRVRPQVVLTYGPEGVSGHRDHIAVGRLATAAFHAAGDPTRWPEHRLEGLEPWAALKLYYLAIPAPVFRALGRPLPAWWTGDEVTTVIETEAYVDVKRAALACHRSQNMSVRRYLDLGREGVRRLAGKEYFHLAWTVVGRSAGKEDDLFRGLR